MCGKKIDGCDTETAAVVKIEAYLLYILDGNMMMKYAAECVNKFLNLLVALTGRKVPYTHTCAVDTTNNIQIIYFS